MVFHAEGVRGSFPLAGARAARAVYTLERGAGPTLGGRGHDAE
jgi:hypothetical protein